MPSVTCYTATRHVLSVFRDKCGVWAHGRAIANIGNLGLRYVDRL